MRGLGGFIGAGKGHFLMSALEWDGHELWDLPVLQAYLQAHPEKLNQTKVRYSIRSSRSDQPTPYRW